MADNRNTRQKEMLKQEIDKLDSFFTGDEIYGKVKKVNSKIGKATVYRFLKQLRDQKLIHSYNCDRKLLYSKNKKSHCHFICEKCSTINHIDIKNLDFLKRNVKEEVCHFQIDVYGICNECKKLSN